MKILQLSNHFWPCIGGIESMVFDLSKALSDLGHEVEVVCLNRCANSKKKLAKEDIVEKIKIHRIPFLDFKYYKIAFSALNFFKKGFDVIHVHGIGFFSDLALLTKFWHKKPVVISTHGGIFHTKNVGFLKKIYFFGWCKLLLNFCDAVVAVSKQDLHLFRKIFKKTVLIENGINLEKFYKLPNKPKRNSFLFVGRISKNKRIDLLVELTAELSKQVPDVKLEVVGKDFDGTLKKLRKLVKEKNIEKNFAFAGTVSEKELLKKFSEAEYFVSASAYEGFGISAVEAMAAGKIVLLNKITAFQNLVKNGFNGFLIDFNQTEKALKQVLNVVKMSSAKKNSVRRNAFKSSERFSVKDKAKEFERVFEAIVK